MSLPHDALRDMEARLNTRTLRLKAVWLGVPFFLWFVAPTPTHLSAGVGLGLFGLSIRGWAAGTIRKEEHLAVTGPYAHTRNPLYVGSLFLGVGITVASGYLAWTAVFLVFYGGVYVATMRGEAEYLTALFGEAYAHYAAHVPALLPRLTAYRPAESGTGPRTDALPAVAGDPAPPSTPPPGGFSWTQYRRNREWEAALGFGLVLGYLAVRWWLRRA